MLITYFYVSLVIGLACCIIGYFKFHKPYNLTTDASGWMILFIAACILWPLLIVYWLVPPKN